jgi:putative transcriptional regulator
MVGRLLVASPSLEDPNFTRTVILLLAHSDEGALGIVLNRPSPADVAEILPQWKPFAADPTRVFLGGPVSPRSVICLAAPASDARPAGIDDTVAGLVSVDLARDPDEIGGAVARLRLFSGYAGWSGGQLEGEMEQGGWILTDPAPGDLFYDDPDELWAAVLTRMGGLRARYAKAPPKLSLN